MLGRLANSKLLLNIAIIMIMFGVAYGFGKIILGGIDSKAVKLFLMILVSSGIALLTVISPFSILLFIAIFTLVPYLANWEIGGLFYANPAEFLTLILTLVLVSDFFIKRKMAPFSFFNAFVVIFMCILILNYVRAPVILANFIGLSAERGAGFRKTPLFLMGIGFCFSFCMGVILADPGRLKRFLNVAFTVILVLVVFNFARLVSGIEIPFLDAMFSWKIHSFVLDPSTGERVYRFGILGVLSSLLMVALISFFDPKKSGFLFWALMALLAVGVVLSGGRASVVFCAVGFITVFLMQGKIRQLVQLAFVAMIVLSLLYFNFDALPANLRRILVFLPGKGLEASGTIQWRVDMWNSAMAIIKDYPIMGIGYNRYVTYTLIRNPWLVRVPDLLLNIVQGFYHNFYITIMVSTGLIGLTSFVSVIVSYAALAIRLYKKIEDDFLRKTLIMGFALLIARITDFFMEGLSPFDMFFVAIGLITAVKMSHITGGDTLHA
jgi:O-antigen ligase